MVSSMQGLILGIIYATAWNIWDMNLVRADQNMWMLSAARTDGQEYYEYILLYVDNCLCISKNPEHALLQVDKYFPIKPASLGPPKT